MFKIKLKIGKSMLEADFANMQQVHKFSAVYGWMPCVCDNCKSDDIFLSHKNPKGNDYFTVTCKNCGAELTLHQKKEGGFYVVNGEKMQVYQKQQQACQQPTQQVVQQPVQQQPLPPNCNPNTPDDDNDIPF